MKYRPLPYLSATSWRHSQVDPQRQLTKAWVRGDIDAADIGTATRRYENLDADTRAEFDDLVQREGPDAVAVSGKVDDETFDAIMRADISTDQKASMLDSISEVDDMGRFDRPRGAVGQKAFRLARTLPGDGGKLETLLRRTDLTTQRILADGSGDLDAEFDRAVVRGLEDPNVDSQQIEEAVTRVDTLENIWGAVDAQAAKRLVINDPDSGSAFLARFDGKLASDLHQIVDSADASELRGAARKLDGLSETKAQRAAELIKETDGPGVRFVDDLEPETLQSALRSDSVSSGEVIEAVRKYDDMDADTQRSFRETVQASGPSSMTLASKLDSDSLETLLDTGPRVMADGGGIMDELARAIDDSDVDLDDPDAWVKNNLDSLDGSAKSRAKDLIDDTDAAGVRLVDEMNKDAISSFFSISDNSVEGVDVGAWRRDIAQQLDSADSIRTDDIERYVNDVSTIVKLDTDPDGPVDIDNIGGVMDEVSNGHSGTIGQQLEADRIAHYARQASDGSTDITKIVSEPGSGRIDIKLNTLLHVQN